MGLFTGANTFITLAQSWHVNSCRSTRNLMRLFSWIDHRWEPCVALAGLQQPKWSSRPHIINKLIDISRIIFNWNQDAMLYDQWEQLELFSSFVFCLVWHLCDQYVIRANIFARYAGLCASSANPILIIVAARRLTASYERPHPTSPQFEYYLNFGKRLYRRNWLEWSECMSMEPYRCRVAITVATAAREKREKYVHIFVSSVAVAVVFQCYFVFFFSFGERHSSIKLGRYCMHADVSACEATPPSSHWMGQQRQHLSSFRIIRPESTAHFASDCIRAARAFDSDKKWKQSDIPYRTRSRICWKWK